jgi:hypothetical protein
MTEKAKILERLRKLTEFKDGVEKMGSLEEAANAAEKIQALILKYNLSEEEIPSERQFVIETSISITDAYSWDKKQGLWILDLAGTLCREYLCRLILTHIHFPKQDIVLRIIGRPDNVEFVKAATINLINQIRQFERVHYHSQQYIKRNKHYRDFGIGAAMGIGAKLREKREEILYKKPDVVVQDTIDNPYLPAIQVKAMILQRTQENEAYIEKAYTNLKQGRARTFKGSSAVGTGYKTGKDLNPQTSLN